MHWGWLHLIILAYFYIMSDIRHRRSPMSQEIRLKMLKRSNKD